MEEKRREVVVFIVTAFMITSVSGLVAPSAAYCVQLGYELTVNKTEEGEFGVCRFPDGSSCKDWDFLRGKCGQEYSYCAQKGYGLKTITGDGLEYAVCILENGTEVEVTELMDLRLGPEIKCGDGICAMEENYGNCPIDCPSGSIDGYCDKLADGTCDLDCKPADDPDCVEATTTTVETTSTDIKPLFPGGDYLIPALVIVILAVVFVFFVIYKRRTEEYGDDEKTIEWLREELRKGEDRETLRKLLDEGGYNPRLLDKAMEE